MLLLSFDRVVSLISLELSWIKDENNITLFVYNNSEMNSFSDKEWSQLLVTDGFQQVTTLILTMALTVVQLIRME